VKTRRTKLVSSLATGLLVIFCAGCTSLTIPEHPVDLRGDGMIRAKGDKFTSIVKIGASGSFSMSGSAPGEGRQRASGKGSMGTTIESQFEVTEASEGKATELRVTNVKQPTQVKFSLSVTGERPLNEVNKIPGAFDGEEYTLKKNENGWTAGPFYQLHGLFSVPDLFPEKKVKAPHKWSWKPAAGLLERLMADGSFNTGDIPDEINLDEVNLEVELHFKGMTQYNGENCAVINVKLSGQWLSLTEPLRGKITISGSGKIYRSLDSYQNLKVDSSVRIRANVNAREDGGSMSANGSASASYRESKEMTHKAEPAPKKPDAESKEQAEPSPKKQTLNRKRKLDLLPKIQRASKAEQFARLSGLS